MNLSFVLKARPFGSFPKMFGKLMFRKSVNAVICPIASITLLPNLSFPNILEMKQTGMLISYPSPLYTTQFNASLDPIFTLKYFFVDIKLLTTQVALVKNSGCPSINIKIQCFSGAASVKSIIHG